MEVPTIEELDQLRHNCEYHREVACMVQASHVLWLLDEVENWRKMSKDADVEGDDWHAKAINLARSNGRREREIRELKARLHVVEAERDAVTWGGVRLTELSKALFACRRAIQSTKHSLTENARREVSMYLHSELGDDEAAHEWDEAVWNGDDD